MRTEDDIPPAALLSAYLKSSGWRLLDENDTWARFSRTFDNNNVVLRVPLRPDAIDYERRVEELLMNLERVEQRSIEHLMRDVKASSSDLIRIRLLGADKGRISVSQGALAFEWTRDLLLAAACAAVKPRPFYHKAKPKQATEYLDRAKFGPTEAGSFVLTVESPVTPELKNQTKLPGIDDIPFGRQVSLTLARATSAVRRAVDRSSVAGSSEYLISSVSEGVTANLCDALMGLLETTGLQSAIELKFRWASSRAVDANTPRMVAFDTNTTTFLDSFSKTLKKQSMEQGVTLRGHVEMLRSRDPNQGGEITLKVDSAIDVEKPSKIYERMVHMELQAHAYREATDAHRLSLRFECVGDLFRDANYSLQNVRRYRVIPQSER
jgi:hypothetical protein